MMRGQSAIPLVIVVLVLLLPVFVVLMRRSIRGFRAMSDVPSSWARGQPNGTWRCGFDLRRPARMTGTYPLGTLRVFDGGFDLSAFVGRIEFARSDIEFVRVERPGFVRITGGGRELSLTLRASDAVDALLSLCPVV